MRISNRTLIIVVIASVLVLALSIPAVAATGAVDQARSWVGQCLGIGGPGGAGCVGPDGAANGAGCVGPNGAANGAGCVGPGGAANGAANGAGNTGNAPAPAGPGAGCGACGGAAAAGSSI